MAAYRQNPPRRPSRAQTIRRRLAQSQGFNPGYVAPTKPQVNPAAGVGTGVSIDPGFLRQRPPGVIPPLGAVGEVPPVGVPPRTPGGGPQAIARQLRRQGNRPDLVYHADGIPGNATVGRREFRNADRKPAPYQTKPEGAADLAPVGESKPRAQIRAALIKRLLTGQGLAPGRQNANLEARTDRANRRQSQAVTRRNVYRGRPLR